MDKYTEFMTKVTLTILTMTLVVLFINLCQMLEQNRYDVNGDGIINSQDYVEIRNHIMEEC